MIGKSFRGCIYYCLEDKQQIQSNLGVVKGRAEVLAFNLCYGNKKELVNQFNEVRNLNLKLSKPVMHISLSLAPGERVDKGRMAILAEECAQSLGFEKNQWIAIAHSDTRHQHLHLVVNRVGFDGRTLSDSNNFKKIAAFCRSAERKHGLRAVLSPRRFLPGQMRNINRNDSRKEMLRNTIKECLTTSSNFAQFEKQMNQRGYLVLKARGIAFVDSKKVRVKGSEVGFSLAKIESILANQPNQKVGLERAEKAIKTQALNTKPIEVLSLQKDHQLEMKKHTSLFQDLLMVPKPEREDIPALIPKKKKKGKSRRL